MHVCSALSDQVSRIQPGSLPEIWAREPTDHRVALCGGGRHVGCPQTQLNADARIDVTAPAVEEGEHQAAAVIGG